MCGLVGIAGTIDSRDKLDFFTTMLYLSALRGMDSTGIASIDRRNKYTIDKVIGPPTNLFDKRSYDKIVAQGEAVILGHNRKATIGKVSYGNAHPFIFDYVLGTHNGTLPHHVKTELEGTTNNFDTDSEALFYAIDKNDGNFPTDKKMMGAWACAWYNFRDKTLNLARNEERTLYYGLNKTKTFLAYASEIATIKYAALRNGIEIDQIYDVPAFTQRKIKIPEYNAPMATANSIKLPGYMTPEEKKAAAEAEEARKKQEEEERKEKWRNTGKLWENGRYVGNRKGVTSLYPGATSYEPERSFNGERNNLLPFKGSKGSAATRKDYLGNLITEELFQQITKGDCCLCAQPLLQTRPFIYINQTDCLCSDCIADVKEHTADSRVGNLAKILQDTFPNVYRQIKESSNAVIIN